MAMSLVYVFEGKTSPKAEYANARLLSLLNLSHDLYVVLQILKRLDEEVIANG